MEQKIMTCWQVIDQIDRLNEYCLNDEGATLDMVANALNGLSVMYTLHFEDLFDEYERSLKS